ncbi:helix-turn-helix transcriptional regulator [Alsobacter sp. KACC 23698]|uniref:Helix-turn-helix transcriptional regulator n=1 Tax=Alsobacter sp. KACC 23698 TaxID=3149229 RepID=A0AAU7JDJ6_9HYPH
MLVLRSPEPDLHTPIATAARLYALTITEVQVLKHIVEGQSLGEAAAVLGIARSTVKTHVDALYAKCGVNSRARLAATIAGLISPVSASP